ncbi:patatin-like phospholipase family protein [Paenibacillus sp. MBLB4367]|uniref:patatin-like phospholipase family protein n=1 Tax=Paenibacillus sp. MBLB4367 TaxID=3384767 RepID=UPI003907F672
MRVNAVFEGGGVKAIGLAGAVHEAQRRGVQFGRVAGTSSGAIIAAMLAAGYSGAEMREIMLGTPFQSFLKQSWLFHIKWVGPAIRLLVKKGLYSGDPLEKWIYELLARKGVRTFGDLKPEQLKIIASDITRGKLLVLPDDIAQYGIDPKKLTVARAIRMSTSIPYFFDPVILRKLGQKVTMKVSNNRTIDLTSIYIVDGGILSNFPLWLFDKQEHDAEGDPTLGFQLVGRGENEPRKIIGPLSMFQALFATMMDAHDERYIEEHKLFRTIKIPSLGVHTTDFSIGPEMSMKLYNAGVLAAGKYLDKWNVKHYWNECGKWNLRTGKRRKV